MRILKRTFILLLIVGLYFLVAYQAFALLSNMMTSAMLSFGWFRVLEHQLTPLMIRTVLVLLHLLHLHARGTTAAVILMRNGAWQNVLISWNCLGWQSVLIFLLTAPFVLLLGYSWSAKFKALLFGLCGTVAVAIARIVTVVLLFQFAGAKPAVFFHDYLAGIGTVSWFCLFWWFSYTFLLKHQAVSHTDTEEEAETGASF